MSRHHFRSSMNGSFEQWSRAYCRLTNIDPGGNRPSQPQQWSPGRCQGTIFDLAWMDIQWTVVSRISTLSNHLYRLSACRLDDQWSPGRCQGIGLLRTLSRYYCRSSMNGCCEQWSRGHSSYCQLTFINPLQIDLINNSLEDIVKSLSSIQPQALSDWINFGLIVIQNPLAQ